MPADVSATLRQALARLTNDRERLDRQIAALRQARAKTYVRGTAQGRRRSDEGLLGETEAGVQEESRFNREESRLIHTRIGHAGG